MVLGDRGGGGGVLESFSTLCVAGRVVASALLPVRDARWVSALSKSFAEQRSGAARWSTLPPS